MKEKDKKKLDLTNNELKNKNQKELSRSKELENKIKKLEDQLSEENKQKNKKENERLQTEKELTSKLQSSQKDVEKIKKKLFSVELNPFWSKFIRESIENEIISLKNDLDELKNTNKILKSEKLRFENDNKKVNEEILHYKNQFNTIKIDFNNNKNENNELQKCNNKIISEKLELEVELSNMRSLINGSGKKNIGKTKIDTPTDIVDSLEEIVSEINIILSDITIKLCNDKELLKEKEIYSLLISKLTSQLWQIIESSNQNFEKEMIVNEINRNNNNIIDKTSNIILNNIIDSLKQLYDNDNIKINEHSNIEKSLKDLCENAVKLASRLDTHIPTLTFLWNELVVEFNPEKHINMYGNTKRIMVKYVLPGIVQEVGNVVWSKAKVTLK